MTTTMTAPYAVIDLRAELNITQVELSAVSKVSQPTISNMESGKPTMKISARKVWRAVNRLRQERGLAPIAFDDVSWNLM